DLCSDMGEGYIIANAATVTRLILQDGAAHLALRDHIWTVLTVDGNICSGKPAAGPPSAGTPSAGPTDFKTAILYFARTHTAGPRFFRHAPDIEHVEEIMAESFRYHRAGAEAREYMCTKHTATLWSAVREEFGRQECRPQDQERRPQDQAYNLWLSQSGIIRTFLSLFQQHSLKIDKAAAATLHEINGKRPMQLVLQRAQRDALLNCIGERSPWKVSPDLATAVAKAIQDYHAQRAPLYPLPEIQRLGYLDEEDEIVCRSNLAGGTPSNLFKAGSLYKIRTHTVTVRRAGKRANLAGEMEDIEYTGQELCILVSDATGSEWAFMESRLRDDKIWIKDLNRNGREASPPSPGQRSEKAARKETLDGIPALDCIDFTLQELVEHFIVPDVPDVAAMNPEAYQRNLEALAEIESLCH
ncbi:MAG: hypothetical protein QOF48_1002, partial [Verrucomicrobiota bacterium]